MAKDDYFVIVYTVLKYLYTCLKKAEVPNPEVISATYFQIPQSYWAYILNHLIADGYIEGIKSIPTMDGCTFTSKEQAQITPKGIEYLFENTLFEKVKRNLKDVKDIIPFV